MNEEHSTPDIDDVPVSADALRFDPPVPIPGWDSDFSIFAISPATNPADTRVHLNVGPYKASNTMRNFVAEAGVAMDPEFIARLQHPRRSASPMAVTGDRTRLDILLFQPNDLYVGGDPTSGRPREQVGRAGAVTWDQLTRLLARSSQSDPAKYEDPKIAKSMRGAWASGRYRTSRRHEDTFVSTQIMGFDIDHRGSAEHANDVFARLRRIIHSTHSSTAIDPRCRVLVMLKEPCTDRAAFRTAHRTMCSRLVAAKLYEEGNIDAAGSDPERLWYLPMHQPGGVPEFASSDGELLDLGLLLAGASRETRRQPERSSGAGQGALRHARQKMAATPKGARHNTVYSIARWLSELGLDDGDIFDALLDAAAPDGDREEREFRAAIQDAITKGRGAR